MPKTYCPSCDATITAENPTIGATTTCRECGEELEIISINPFEVDFPLDYEDEWEDEDWDDEVE